MTISGVSALPNAKPPAARATVALVGTSHPGSAISPAAWQGALHFQDAEELLTSDFAAEAIVLAPVDETQAIEWLHILRRDARLGLKPVLLDRPFGAHAMQLSDGVAADTATAARHASEMAQRAADAGQPTATSEERLLAFLHLRPKHILTPVIEWRDTRICHYPVADTCCAPGEDGFELIDRLRSRGLLENTTLIERIHACHRCGAGQLLFVEHCPQCGGIDIGEQNFLHCYACGHVDTQETFLRHDALLCPHCNARLRHIGVDYDRALETLSCRTCHARFTEPEVKARCLQCRTSMAPDALSQRRFYGLKLTAAGELTARTGQMGDVFKLIDEFSHARPEYFLQTLDWLIDVSRRHPEVQFGVVCLTFANVHELAARLPRQRLVQLFDALAQRLRTLIRTTDLFMRESDSHCWLLLPQTSPAGMEVLLQRIAALGKTLTSDDQRIEIAVSARNSGDIPEAALGARVLMSMLRDPAG